MKSRVYHPTSVVIDSWPGLFRLLGTGFNCIILESA